MRRAAADTRVRRGKGVDAATLATNVPRPGGLDLEHIFLLALLIGNRHYLEMTMFRTRSGRVFFRTLLVVVVGLPALVIYALLETNDHWAPWVKEYYLEAFKIPSTGMEPGIRPGDHILVDKSYYRSHKPRNGDIVLFTIPDDPATPDTDESKVHIAKRIVATEGQTVEVSREQLLIDGKPIKEAYAVWSERGIFSFGPAEVPSRTVFLLGDNRDKSRDSRHWRLPFVDEAQIQGKVRWIYWPPARISAVR